MGSKCQFFMMDPFPGIPYQFPRKRECQKFQISREFPGANSTYKSIRAFLYDSLQLFRTFQSSRKEWISTKANRQGVSVHWLLQTRSWQETIISWLQRVCKRETNPRKIPCRWKCYRLELNHNSLLWYPDFGMEKLCFL